MGVVKDLSGRTFGRLTVPKNAKPKMRDGHAYWPVICECHPFTVKWVRGSKLLDGNTVSCGCWRADPDVRHAARVGPGEEEHYNEAYDQAYEQWCDDQREALEDEFERLESEIGEIRGNAESASEEAGQGLNAPDNSPDDEWDEILSRRPGS